MPSGIVLSTAGMLSGNVSSYGQFNATYQVRDSANPSQISYATLTLPIVAQLVIQTTTLSTSAMPPNVGANYQAVLSFFGGLGTSTWRLQPGSAPLPPGLILTASNGLISGVPTMAGTYTFTAEIDNAGPPQQSAAQTYSLTITNNLVIGALNGYLQAVTTKPFQATLQGFGGQPPYTWGFVGKSTLPSGLSLDPSTGVISGVLPQISGNYDSFATAIELTDSSSPPQTAETTVTIWEDSLLHFDPNAVIEDGIVNENYFTSIPAEGGLAPYQARLIAGNLPPGLSFEASPDNLELFGVVATAGSSTATIQVTDSETPPASIQQSFTFRVNPRLEFSFAQLPNALVGHSYSYTEQASGGLFPLHWTLTPYIPLPGDLSIDPSTGMITGTPSQAIQETFFVIVSDSSVPPQSAENNCYVQVLGPVTITTSALPNVALNAPVSLQLAAEGGIGQYTWNKTSGAFPIGLSIDPATGKVSGKATAAGSSVFSVQAVDAGPPQQTSNPVTLQLTVGASLGRNDSPASATPLSNGTYQASISPVADPPTGVPNPDTDYYALTANPGATVTVEITAQRLTPPSPLDSVLEIVDAGGDRLALCNSNPLSTLGPFNQPCLNDDLEQGVSTDSKLTLQVPATNTGPLPFYAHVLDWRGDARPEMVYTITIAGAN